MLAEIEGKSIAIVGLGASFSDFVMARINSTQFDEIWGINCIGGVFHVDRTFMLDPASRFLDDIKAGTQTGIAKEFLTGARKKGPIYSCCLDERVPEIELYPLQEVITATKFSYFNNTVAYAVAAAIAYKASKIYLYGIDFSYRQNLHLAESGRGCVEFWCGVAVSNGISIEVAPRSSFMDTNVPEDEKLYGYHRLDDPLVQKVVNGELVICPKSCADEYKSDSSVFLEPPEPMDDSIFVGRHDVEGVTYHNTESENE